MVNPDGSNPKNSIYYAFGGSRNSAPDLPTDKMFAGYRQEGSTGMCQVGARWYDPELGRFVQPDPTGQLKLSDTSAFIPLTVAYYEPSAIGKVGEWNRSEKNAFATLDPQLLNRYSYSRNNPLTYFDPSGKFVWVVVGAVVGGIAGAGYYVVNHWDEVQQGNWDCGELATNVAIGAVGGATLGLGAEAAVGVAAAASAAEITAFDRLVETVQSGRAAGTLGSVRLGAEQLGVKGLETFDASLSFSGRTANLTVNMLQGVGAKMSVGRLLETFNKVQTLAKAGGAETMEIRASLANVKLMEFLQNGAEKGWWTLETVGGEEIIKVNLK